MITLNKIEANEPTSHENVAIKIKYEINKTHNATYL